MAAFPAELAPLASSTAIDVTVDVAGRRYHLGRLDGVRVVLGLTGIGLVNAEQATERLLSSFDVAGLVMTGVAGSVHRIGDVVVARRFAERDRKRAWATNRALRALARRATRVLHPPLERCTPVPPTDPGAPLVCLPHDPRVVFEKRGHSDDPFGDVAFPCTPDGGEIFGCTLPAGAMLRAPATEDMETAAVARVAAARRIPFLAVRAVSDGAGDPLGDRGFPAQFFDYYRLAADNAGAVTRAVVAELGRIAGDEAHRRTCRLLRKGRWRQAAMRLRQMR